MDSTQRTILIHRWTRRAWRVAVPLVLLSVVLSRLLFAGDDWSRFDRHSVHVTRVVDGTSFQTAEGSLVHLLGVQPNANPQPLRDLVEGKDVHLKLDSPQTRSTEGQLMAYVYLAPSDCVNLDLIRDGFAKADRRTPFTLQSSALAAEREAQHKKRGA